MKEIKIDSQKCIKCARCVALFPENFTLEEDSGLSSVKSNDNVIYEMEQICPTNAIKVEENENDD